MTDVTDITCSQDDGPLCDNCGGRVDVVPFRYHGIDFYVHEDCCREFVSRYDDKVDNTFYESFQHRYVELDEAAE
jgi:hypothetical protein